MYPLFEDVVLLVHVVGVPDDVALHLLLEILADLA